MPQSRGPWDKLQLVSGGIRKASGQAGSLSHPGAQAVAPETEALQSHSSRRDFLAAGLALPGLRSASVAGLGAEPALQYRTLGRTGLKVTTVGFGCMITSDPSVIQRAADLGINYFDTARVYGRGNNERMVGAVLKSRRKSIILSSKSQARSKQAALADLDASLRELGTDYLDVWCIHDRTRGEEITDELLEAQQIAKKDGKIRFAGVSTHRGQASVIPAALKCSKIDVVISGYNFAMDKDLDPVLESAHQAGLGLVAMKVMAGGFRNASYYPTTNELRSQLKREGALLAALKWAIRNPYIHTSIPSMVDMDQLDENLKAMASPFTEADQKILSARLEQIRPLYCRMCNRCEGTCPKGMPVPDVLRYLTYAEGYGQFALGREKFLELPSEVQEIRCNLCSSCSVSCSFGVKVAERLIRAQELLA